jgi:hypothetical protein
MGRDVATASATVSRWTRGFVARLGLEILAWALARPVLSLGGRALSALAAVGYASLLLGLFVQRWRE